MGTDKEKEMRRNKDAGRERCGEMRNKRTRMMRNNKKGKKDK